MRSLGIGIIGAGRIGSALAYHLARKGWRIAGLCDIDRERAREAARRVPTGIFENAEKLARRADILFLTLPDSAIALQLMIWSIPVGFVNSVTHYVLIALNQQRYLTRCFLVGLAFSAGSNLLLIPVFGYRAAGALHLFSELTLLIAFYLGLRRHMAPVPWVRLLWRPALAGAIMGGTAWLLYGVHLLLAAIAALVVYVVALVAVGTFRDPDMGRVVRFAVRREE